MAIANTSDYYEQNENAVASATAKPLAEKPATTVVEGLLAIPNVHDSDKIDLVTFDGVGFDGKPRKCCWGTVHIDFFGSYSGPWHKALVEGEALKLNVVEG